MLMHTSPAVFERVRFSWFGQYWLKKLLIVKSERNDNNMDILLFQVCCKVIILVLCPNTLGF